MEWFTRKTTLIALSVLVTTNPLFAEDGNQRVLRDKRRGDAVAILNDKALGHASSSKATSRAATSQNLTSSNSVLISDAYLKTSAHHFGISNVTDLHPINVSSDSFGMQHVRYRQAYNGVPVYGAELVAHINAGGIVRSVNGRTLKDININTRPKLSSKKALNRAKALAKKSVSNKIYKVSAKKLKKDCLSNEFPEKCVARRIKKLEKRFGFYATELPVLYIMNKSFLDNKDGGETNLVWEVKLKGSDELSPTYFINAMNGELVYFDSGIRHLNRAIYDCSDDVGDLGCYLDLWTVHGGQEFTFGRSEGQPERGPNPSWASFPGSTDVDTLYDLAEEIHTYFAVKFARNGANGQGGTGNGSSFPLTQTRFVAHADLGGEGTEFCFPGRGGARVVLSTSSIRLCHGSAVGDVVAHEYAHVVTLYNALPTGETGALVENFSDIISESFQNYKDGSTDWEFGTDNLVMYRSLHDPHSISNTIPNADRFHDPIFYCGTSDNGGVHANSTVPSKAAYLISEGGTFNGCTIRGIGLDKVEQIWYRAVTQYLTSSETFNSAYNNFILACNDLAQPGIGLTTLSDCDELTKALQAVEMDQPGACSGIPAVPPACSQGNACQLTGSFANI